MGKDSISSLFLAVIGLFFLIYSSKYDLGTLASPGEAVFPMLIAVVLVAMSGWLLLQSLFKQRPENQRQKSSEEKGIREENWRVLLLFSLVGISLFSIEVLGFFLTSFILVVLCCRLLGVNKWLPALTIAAAAITGAYLIFELWLKVAFPKGLCI